MLAGRFTLPLLPKSWTQLTPAQRELVGQALKQRDRLSDRDRRTLNTLMASFRRTIASLPPGQIQIHALA